MNRTYFQILVLLLLTIGSMKLRKALYQYVISCCINGWLKKFPIKKILFRPALDVASWAVCTIFIAVTITNVLNTSSFLKSSVIKKVGLYSFHIQYRHSIPAPVNWTSASAWLYNHPWVTCQKWAKNMNALRSL